MIPIQSKNRCRHVQLIAKIRLAESGPNLIGIVIADPREALHILVEVVVDARREHVLAEIRALPGCLVESRKAEQGRHQTVLLGAFAADKKKCLVFDQRAAVSETILLPAVIIMGRKASQTEK